MLATIAYMSVPEIIGELVEKYGSINAAARACGMSEPTLWMLYRGKRKAPTLETLRMIAGGLGVSLVDLVARMEYGSGLESSDIRQGRKAVTPLPS